MLQCRVEQLKAHKANCTLSLLVASPRLRFHCTFVFGITESILGGERAFLLVHGETGKPIGKINQDPNGNLWAGLDLLL